MLQTRFCRPSKTRHCGNRVSNYTYISNKIAIGVICIILVEKIDIKIQNQEVWYQSVLRFTTRLTLSGLGCVSLFLSDSLSSKRPLSTLMIAASISWFVLTTVLRLAIFSIPSEKIKNAVNDTTTTRRQQGNQMTKHEAQATKKKCTCKEAKTEMYIIHT